MALRDNDRAAEAFGIPSPRVRLATYALSGAIAALAGGLFVHHQQAFDPSSYAPVQNLVVFTMVVVGGLTSVTGAFLGALFLLGTQWFLVRRLARSSPRASASSSSCGWHPAGWPRSRSACATGRCGPWPGGGGSSSRPRPTRTTGERPAPAPAAPAAATNGAPPLLEVRDLEVSYGPVQILFGVDLVVAEGEAVALLGTNGAGKSTLLRSVSGLLPPGGGRVVLDGEDVTGRPAHELARRGLAEMPGGAGIFPSLTVAENLRAAGWLHRRDPTSWPPAARRWSGCSPT